MKVYLNPTERSKLLKRLSAIQRESLFKAISITHKSEFGNILASYRGTQKWDFLRYIDHGERTSSARCECGRQLRHEFVIKHNETKVIRSLGINHLKEELGIPEEIAKAVYNKMHCINYDIDEILTKVREGWVIDRSILNYIEKYKPDLSMDIKILLEVNLPLLERHLDRIFNNSKSSNTTIKKNSCIGVTAISNEQSIDPLPDDLSSIHNDIYKNIVSLVNKFKGARYIITRQKLSFKVFDEINFPGRYFDYDVKYKQLRYGFETFDISWSHYSSDYIYRGTQYGPKLCIAKIDLLKDDYIGLWVIFGYKSMKELKVDANRFLKKYSLPIETDSLFL